MVVVEDDLIAVGDGGIVVRKHGRGATWTLQNSAGGHLEKLAYNRRECPRSAAGVILLSRDQPTIVDPFPEQVAAVLLLVAVYALNRQH